MRLVVLVVLLLVGAGALQLGPSLGSSAYAVMLKARGTVAAAAVRPATADEPEPPPVVVVSEVGPEAGCTGDAVTV